MPAVTSHYRDPHQVTLLLSDDLYATAEEAVEVTDAEKPEP